MFKHIFTYIWNTRKSYVWLMLELTAVSVVCWMMTDPVFVLAYNKHLPAGYDASRTYYLDYTVISSDDAPTVDDFMAFIRRLRSNPDVECATFFPGFNAFGASGKSYNTMCGVDSLHTLSASFMLFVPGQDFFRTWQLGDWEKLDRMSLTGSEIILTSDAADYLGIGNQLKGKQVTANGGEHFTIAGVVPPLNMQDMVEPVPTYFMVWPADQINPSGQCIAFRTKDISPSQFSERFVPWMEHSLSTDKFKATKAISFHDFLDDSNRSDGVTNEVNSRLMLSCFFLITMFLGVSGTYWWSTRRRKEEIGIRLSYGASPARICRMLLAEGTLLTTVAVTAGCLIALQFVNIGGFYTHNYTSMAGNPAYLTNQFLPHFLCVSGIVYALMLLVTWTGILVPALNISRVSPVDCLRDE